MLQYSTVSAFHRFGRRELAKLMKFDGNLPMMNGCG